MHEHETRRVEDNTLNKNKTNKITSVNTDKTIENSFMNRLLLFGGNKKLNSADNNESDDNVSRTKINGQKLMERFKNKVSGEAIKNIDSDESKHKISDVNVKNKQKPGVKISGDDIGVTSGPVIGEHSSSAVDDADNSRTPDTYKGEGLFKVRVANVIASDHKPVDKKQGLGTTVNNSLKRNVVVKTKGEEDYKNTSVDVNIVTGLRSSEPKSVSVHKIALGRFLQDLCDDSVKTKDMPVLSNSKEFGDECTKLPEAKDIVKKKSVGFVNDNGDSKEHMKKRFDELKGRDGKEILSKEFGKDGMKLKMKLIRDDEKVLDDDEGEDDDEEEEGVERHEIVRDKFREDYEVLKRDLEEKERDGDVKLKRVDIKENEEGKKPSRKVSFKVSKTMGTRRKPVESRVILSSNVAALASKYNGLTEDEEEYKPFDNFGSVLMKSSARTDIKVIVSRRNSTKRDAAGALSNFKTSVTKKVEDVCKFKEKRNNVSITYRPSILKTRVTNVKAAIQIFEQNSNDSSKRLSAVEEKENVCSEKKKKVKEVLGKQEERVLRDVETKSESQVGKEFCDIVENNATLENCSGDRDVVLGSNKSSLFSSGIQKSVRIKDLDKVVMEEKTVKLKLPEKEESKSKLFKGLKYGAVKVLPNKSGVFSSDKDTRIELVENKSTLFSNQFEYGTVYPLEVTNNAAIGAKLNQGNGDHKSAKRNLNKNLERDDSSTTINNDDVAYEEVNTNFKPKRQNYAKTTSKKISKITQKVMSFPNHLKSKPEIPAKSEIVLKHSKDATMKPNTSFLWGTIESKSKLDKIQKFEQPDIELHSDEEDGYDDVYPPSFYGTNSSLHYSSVDNIYDDVGNLDEGTKKTNLVYPGMNPNDDTPLGYDYVSSRNSISNFNLDNIYDDVKTLSMKVNMIKDDTISVSNCYESIYNGDNIKEVSSGGSSGSTKSFCELNNSLYGGVGSRFDSSSVSQASTASVEDNAHEVNSYQLTSMGQPRSDTSATSDEWMDMEISDGELEAGTFNVVVEDRSRCRRSPSWSQRVRRQWSSRSSRSPGKHTGDTSGGDSSESDTDHHYEMLYEVIEPKHDVEIPFDDFDSLDSDNSDDGNVKSAQTIAEGYNNRLPEPPTGQNIYGITKMAEAAGNKLLKFRKSLSRMRQKRHTTEIRLSTPLTPVSPPVPPLPLPSRNAPLTPPPPPRPPLEKAESTRVLPNRKYWSLRKFRRSTSVGQAAETSTFYLTEAVDADSGKTVDVRDRTSVGPETTLKNGSSPNNVDGLQTAGNEVGSDNSSSSSARISKPALPDRRPSVRPNSPPPLPPQSQDAPKRPNRKDKRAASSTTSWYAECGLFDGSEADAKRSAVKDRPLSSSWYADVGLWNAATSSPNDSLSEQVSDVSRTSQTDISDSSLSADTNGGAERRFVDEPLYQFYTAAVVELARRGMNGEFDSDGYEEIGCEDASSNYSRPTAMELIPRHGQHRTLWCEIPEVINSAVLNTLSTHQKKLQEAKFEIIASEASYMNSLNVLNEHFLSSPEFNDETVLSKSDRRILFSNVLPVRSCSKRFLAELEKCWQDNILLHDVCDVIDRHATTDFAAYVKYCSNQIYLDRTLRRLKDQQGKFAEVLTQLESSPVCQSLSLHSFLMLPMQRITRLPLLIDAVLTRLTREDEEYENCMMALARLNKIVKDCNEGARRMERMEEILILSHQLEFPRDVKAVPIISSSRWLVRSGQVTQLVWRGDDVKLTFGKKFSKSTLHVFLFTDLLVVTKKKSDDCYSVVDYCPRNLVQMTSCEGLAHLPVKFMADGGKNLILLTLLHNHEKKTVEMILSCSVESERQRWLQAVSQPTSEDPEESVYEHWDCPQVSAVHLFLAAQPDELALDIADVVNVFRKTKDGWYYGQRIRDGENGWFPGNHTAEVASAHVRAKNLKQRYRLLALSGNFLESQRKDKQSK